MKIKLTNEIIDQLSFAHRPVGVDKKGRLVTVNNTGKVTASGDTKRPEAYIVRDTEVLGFAVRVSPNSVSFMVQRKMGGSSSPKRVFGAYGREYKSVSDARKTAQQWLARMAKGEDPILLVKAEQDRSKVALEKMRNTFAKAYDQYMVYKQGGAASSIRDRQYVKDEVSKTVLWNTPLDQITTQLVENAFRPWFLKGKIATGWKIYRCCRAAYGIATGKPGQDPTNPFSVWRAAADLPEVPVKETYLPTHKPEGTLWLKTLVALRDNPTHSVNVAADYLLCVLFWGGRKTETQRVRWEDVDFENRTVTFNNTKNKKTHIFPMTPYVAKLLRERKEKNAVLERTQKTGKGVELGNWVFPSRVRNTHIVDIRNVLNECQKASGLNIQAHDLRRTFATQLASKTDLSTVKLAMNHANATRDVTWRYVQEKIELLRPLYEARETYLLQLADLMPKADEPASRTEQPIDIDMLKAQLREAKARGDAKVRRLVMQALLDEE